MKKTSIQLTREQQAKIEAGHTAIRPGAALAMTAVFLFLIGSVPLVQHSVDIGGVIRGKPDSTWSRYYDFFRRVPGILRPLFAGNGPLVRRIVAVNRDMLREMNAFEDAIDDDSAVGQAVRPQVQYVLSRWLGVGNELAYCGRGKWLFYRPDIDYLTGPGFLDPAWLAARVAAADEWLALPQPDPVEAIAHFNGQLAERGIKLIVMPTPVKPAIHPEKFARAYEDHPAPLQNVSYEHFIRELARRDVLVFDVSAALADDAKPGKSGRPDQYLQTDTHWRPETVVRVATLLKEFIERHAPLPGVPAPDYTYRRDTVVQLGDIAAMLKLPERQTFYPPERASIRQVLESEDMFWSPDSSADVLVLGDSFSNIYSQEGLGWGESAGLIEQLSFEMRRPIDRIVQNDNAAFATRAMLARDLARGRDRLAGKQLVIYQFASRELTMGDWKIIDLDLGDPAPSKFVVPEPGSELIVRGLVKSVSPVPRPGTVPYRDHIMSVHLVDIEHREDDPGDGQALVYTWSMTNNVWTRAARLRPDETVEARLKPWSDVADRYEGFNRSEPDDVELLLEEPCWGEELFPE